MESARRSESLREEMELHLEEKAAEFEADGMTPECARAEARRRFDVTPQTPSIHPFNSSRWRAGYSEPSSTRSSLPDHC